MTTRRALLLFARFPAIGQVKSRLIPRFGAADALALHRALLMDSLDLAGRAAQASGAQGLLYLSEAGKVDDEMGSHLAGWRVRTQQGADLGERLMQAFRECFDSGYREVLVLGSDSPHLPQAYVTRGFEELRLSDLVIGPARDGGYYLLGATCLFQHLLTDMRWGSADVYRETVRRARKTGIPIASLPAWYDVDLPEAVTRLWQDLASQRDRGERPLAEATLSLLDAWARQGQLS
jgi:rSAM/selenodomain-associated transferase 1